MRERERLRHALARIALRDLDELAGGQHARRRLAARAVVAHQRLDGDVQPARDGRVRVAVDRVVQARAAIDAGPRGAVGRREQAGVVVRLADLRRDDDLLPDVGQDLDVRHEVVAANVADAAVGGVRDVEDGGAGRGDGVEAGRGVEGGRVARRSCGREGGAGDESGERFEQARRFDCYCRAFSAKYADFGMNA